MKISRIDLRDYIDFSESEMIISKAGDRLLIFDAMALGLLRRELIEMFGWFGAKNVLTRFGYTHGYRIGEMLRRKGKDDLEELCAGASHHLLYGITCTTDIEKEYLENNNFVLNCYLKKSYEAEQHLLYIGKSTEPVCWTITGFASGFETSRRGIESYCFELECEGQGDDRCMMQNRLRVDWDEDTLREQLPFYGTSSIPEMLKELSSQLQRTKKSLQTCKTKLTLENEELHDIIVRSKKMQNIIHIAKRAAIVDSSVVIFGESGVGKEVISRHIHNSSSRASKPFIAVNCGAFAESLLESELFGHAKGAFTGASTDHKGLFEEANGGTLFLDEIGETSLSMQVKLLRVIQERELRRVGETKVRKLDVRIITATNKNLAEEVEKGNFRKDLYYRLRIIEINIPPLRDRGPDILPLAHLFLKKYAKQMGKDVTGISSKAAKCLLNYEWPGNVRELNNSMERAVAFADSNLIQLEDLPEEVRHKTQFSFGTSNITLAEMEKRTILLMLETCDNDKQVAARRLQIGLSTLYKKLKEYGISSKNI